MIRLDGMWQDLSEYHGLNNSDLELLHRHQAFFEENAEAIVDEFYDRIAQNPDLLSIIERHSTIQRLKGTQVWYLKTLGTNVLDMEYVRGRERIGKVHAAIQLPLSWYLSSYSIYIRLIHERVSELPVTDRLEFYTAVVKRLLFDGAIISEQYHSDVVDLTERTANYDSLTGVANRKYFMKQLNDQLREGKVPLAIYFIDIDSFKEINDSFGHDAGDQVLRIVAQRMKACIREGDRIGRIGGDEFIMFASEIFPVSEVEEIADRLLESIQKPIVLGHQQIYVTASIGVAMYRDHTISLSEVLRASDIAMYTAKGEGKNRYHLVGLSR